MAHKTALTFERHRILIWGKTYPELSWRHSETVCTGGCFEDGRPIRLYPVALRHLPEHRRYKLYDWIDVPIAKSGRDHRPESYRVRDRDIKVGDNLGTNDGWAARRRVIFKDDSWHYECIEDLRLAQRRSRNSLGVVRVGAIDRVRAVRRPDKDRREHDKKLAELQTKTDLFGKVQKDLAFVPERVQVEFQCERNTGRRACPGHKTKVLDWGVGELARREGIIAAVQKVEEISDLARHDLHFFMGNFKEHPTNFGILGLWYPLLRDTGQSELALDA